MNNHVAISITACAPTCDAAILAIGAVSFDLKGKIKARFYEEVDSYYAQQGRRFDPKTMLQLVTSKRHISRLAAPADKLYSLATVLDNLASWCANAGGGAGSTIWASRSHLTIAAIEHAYFNNAVGRAAPWKDNVCDLGTLIKMTPSGVNIASAVTQAHNAPATAQDEAELVALTVINITGTPAPAAKVKATPAVVDDDEL